MIMMMMPMVYAADSTSWHKFGDTSKTCDWVAAFTKRCGVKGVDKTLAMYACEDACSDYNDEDEDEDEDEDLDVDAQIMQEWRGGQYRDCPAESMWWSHDESVFGGYTGCVAENRLLPCGQDGYDSDAMLEGKNTYLWTGSECVETGTTVENRTFWIMWGLPADTSRLMELTGLNPVVKFPLLRQSYPAYSFQGVDSIGGADDLDAIPSMKSWLEYIDAWTADELEDYGIIMDEGAEQGMVWAIGGKMLEFAQLSCTRQFYLFMEAPAYGYSTSSAARFANLYSSRFLDDCPEDTPDEVSISVVGWLPGTDLPVRTGGDGNEYTVEDVNVNSPWIETLVFPENPSGVLKITRAQDSNRRVCDGVYLYPMFFSDGEIPKEKLPECSTWAFSATKIYSAMVRTGFLMYNLEPETNGDAMKTIAGSQVSLTYGDYSEWSWWGHMQINDILMAKPYTDETSWVGAYTTIQQAKWTAITEGFDGCPYVEITNPFSGAYAWFRMLDPYLGLHDGVSENTFFAMVIGSRNPTYSWGFRGADPADYYGEGYGTYDFIRMQLFRSQFVYEEVGRRASIACNGGAVEGYLSGEEWAAMMTDSRRRLSELTVESAADIISTHAPRLSKDQVNHHANLWMHSKKVHDNIEASCAPSYETSCLFAQTGRREPDLFVPAN